MRETRTVSKTTLQKLLRSSGARDYGFSLALRYYPNENEWATDTPADVRPRTLTHRHTYTRARALAHTHTHTHRVTHRATPHKVNVTYCTRCHQIHRCTGCLRHRSGHRSWCCCAHFRVQCRGHSESSSSCDRQSPSPCKQPLPKSRCWLQQ